MSKIIDLIKELPISKWDYYQGINNSELISNPFTSIQTHNDFIKKYFIRGGKIELLKTSDIKINNLRLPNHINSVFFLGILIYNKTGFSSKI